MPYTPPTQSPAASPAQSRSASISLQERPSTITPGHPPPRSSSYLKLRRSSHSQPSPNANRPLSESTAASQSRSSSLHQSPSPVNQSSYIPTGAIVSPPDSTQNSSDDEGQDPMEMHRGRQIDNLDELKEAIKILPQRRTPSPDNSGKHSAVDGHHNSRRHGHNRSTSDSSFLKQLNKSNAESDVEDEGYRIAPPMVRKKSGELVKSSLKTPNRSRPSSVPSTPTFPKAVHFDQHLEHVRHFMHTEKPTAVSAGSSPVESFDDDHEFPFDSEEPSYMSPPFEWEIGLPNFPKDPNARKHLPVRVERVYLSTDKQNLLGCVAVKNISFQKLVVVRFTLDYWQTVSEVTAEFSNDVRKKLREENYDRFIFKVKLQDLANLDTKTLFFCVRYVVNGQELWDNNNHMNFQVDFKKKFLPVNGKSGGVRMSLPRTRPSPTLSRQSPSMQNIDSFDNFDDLSSITTQVDKPVPRSSVTIGEVSELVRRANSSGNVFSTRYDFTASLSAAISAANTIMGPRSGLSDKSNSANSQPEDSPYFKFTGSPKSETLASPVPQQVIPVAEPKEVTTMQVPTKLNAGQLEAPAGEKPPIESLSYRELLETYCFFGSARNSPQLNQTQILEEANVTHDEFTHNHPILSAYTLGGAAPGAHSPSPPTSLNGSPILDIAQSPRYTPPNGSPPSLSGSQRSSATSSPVPFGTYKYQPRRNHGGFAFDAPTHATAIRG